MIHVSIILTLVVTFNVRVFSQIAGSFNRNAILGYKAILPCYLKTKDPKDFATLVLWYKGSTDVPLYSYDSRAEMTPEEPLHHKAEFLGNRGIFNVNSEPATLEIDDVQEHDEGIYKCRVDFQYARTLTYTVKLTVIIPPSKPVISDMTGRTFKDSIGPFNEDGNLYLICTCRTGKPSAELKWFRNGQNIDSTFEEQKNGVVRNELFLEGLSRNDLHAELKCAASNNNITEPADTTVQIELNLKPLTVNIQTPKEPFSANKMVKILCRSSGSRPPAVITWLKGSKKMSGSENILSEDISISNSMLSFIPTSVDHGKYLSCRAENPNLPGSAKEDGWILNVKYPPEVSLINTYGAQTAIREGERINFDCVVKSNPIVDRVTWYFEGRVIRKQFPEVAKRNYSLIVKNVSKKHIGEYWCCATNKEGKGISDKIKLFVKFVPTCASSHETMISVSINEATKVKCRVNADPKDVTFSWKFNNSRKEVDIETFSQRGLTSLATFVPQQDDDYGQLLCFAKNDIGVQEKPCVFIVQKAGPPHKVSNCVVVNQTSTSIHVRCKPGFDGGLRQWFVMEVFEKWTHTLTDNVSSTDEPDFVAKNLPSEMEFLVIIYAANSKGKGRSITLRAFTLMSPQKQTGEKESSYIMPLVGIVIGVLASLLAIAICIVVMVRRKQGDVNRYYEAHKAYSQRNHVACNTVKQFSEERDPDIIPYLNSVEHPVNRSKDTSIRTYSENLQSSNPNTENDDLVEYASCRVKAVSQSPLNRNISNVNNTLNSRHKSEYSIGKKHDDVTFAELSIPLVKCRSSPRHTSIVGDHCSSSGVSDGRVHFVEPVRLDSGDVLDIERHPVTAETPLIDKTATESAV